MLPFLILTWRELVITQLIWTLLTHLLFTWRANDIDKLLALVAKCLLRYIDIFLLVFDIILHLAMIEQVCLVLVVHLSTLLRIVLVS